MMSFQIRCSSASWLVAADERPVPALTHAAGRGTGDGPGAAPRSTAGATVAATLTGGDHGLAGAARSGSWLRIRACSSTSSGVGSSPSSSASSALRLAEDAQRVGLAAAAVEGDHQPPGEALAQRVLVDRVLELGHRLAVAAEREQGVEPGLERLQAQLVPPHRRRARPVLVGDVGEHRTAPLGEPGLEVGEGGARVAGQIAAGGGDAVLEAGGVEQPAIDGEEVAGPSRRSSCGSPSARRSSET